MKLIRSTGKVLEVYNIESPIMKFVMRNAPLKENGYRITSDDDARARVRKIIDSGVYERII